jgi:hypothetical protein
VVGGLGRPMLSRSSSAKSAVGLSSSAGAVSPAHDKYGFSIDDQQQHQDQQRYYNGRYQTFVEAQRERWTKWLAANPLASRDPRREGHTRPFQKGEACKIKELVSLARKGIPPERRGMVWIGVSGARARLEASRSGDSGEKPYAELQRWTPDPGTEAAEKLERAAHEIEKDLRRTFPKHKTLSTDEKQDKLRSILTCYAKRNPRVGYVQSMNYIGALLLLFMEEDEAFWTLSCIVEDLLPDSFYADNMSSLLEELELFDELTRTKLPALARHFERLNVSAGGKPVRVQGGSRLGAGGGGGADSGGRGGGAAPPPPPPPPLGPLQVDVKAICSQWFLLVFVNVLPLESVLRVWDSFFVEGSQILFRVALAVLE